MNYFGFEITPLGNVDIKVSDKQILVFNTGGSGLDGIQINSHECNNLTVHYAPFDTLEGNRGELRDPAMLITASKIREFTITNIE